MIALSISQFHVIIKQKIKGAMTTMPEILYEIPVNDIFATARASARSVP